MSEQPQPRGGRPARTGIAALGEVLEGRGAILVYSHMNPDPDTIGAGLGLRFILGERFGKQVGLCYRGIIGRAENREMTRLLAPDLLPARLVNQDEYSAAFLVDAQPSYGIDPVLDKLPVIGVVDHHPKAEVPENVPFVDIRPDYGSTCTIVTEYVRELDLVPTAKIATALFYGLKCDTMDLTRRTSDPDVAAYEWLFPKVDRQILARIENPPLSWDYFDTFAAAVSRAVAYKQSVVTELGRMAYPDMVAEVADRLIRLDGMQWAVVFGQHEKRVYFSVRTTHPTKHAGEVVKDAVSDCGVGGGHDSMAAGRVDLDDGSEEAYTATVASLWGRFLAVLGEDPADGRPLVRSTASRPRIAPVT